MTSTSGSPVKLGSPGAGLPLIELIIACLGFAVSRVFLNRQTAMELYTKETERILQNIANKSPAQLESPVLIERVFGIEDSSRGWSITMTLEHLNIVNGQII